MTRVSKTTEKTVKDTIKTVRKEFCAVGGSLYTLHRLTTELARRWGKTGKEYDNFIHEIERES